MSAGMKKISSIFGACYGTTADHPRETGNSVCPHPAFWRAGVPNTGMPQCCQRHLDLKPHRADTA